MTSPGDVTLNAHPRSPLPLLLRLGGLGLGGAAHADMDIEDRGPVLDAVTPLLEGPS